jgi:O-antigen/teichoic acid export membrane protein
MSQGVRKGSIFSLLGYGFAGLFLALFHAFAGRWLGVEYYGLLNILLSYINIATALVAVGIMEGITRYISFYRARMDETKEEEIIQTSSLTYLVLLSMVIAFSLFIKKPILKNHFNNNITIFYQFLLGTVFLSLFRFYNGLLKGYRKFDLFSVGNVLQAFMMFCFLFIFIKLLVLSKITAGWSIAIASLIVIIFYQLLLKINFIQKLKNIKNFNWDIIKFIFAATFISLMNIWLFRAGPILLKTFGESEADKLAGLFAAIVMPLNILRIIVMSLQAGLYPNLSRAYSIKNNNLIKRYIFKSFAIIIGIISILLPIYYFYGPEIVLLIYKKQEFMVSRLDTTLLALVYSFYFLGLHLTKIMMARNTPGYSSLSLALGIAGMFAVLLWSELPPLKLIGVSLLVCNLLYSVIQGLFFLILKAKKNKKDRSI